jgi:hypothetical protein
VRGGCGCGGGSKDGMVGKSVDMSGARPRRSERACVHVYAYATAGTKMDLNT